MDRGNAFRGSHAVHALSRVDSWSFCPCCLLTNSYGAFESLIESDGFFAIRLLAMRNGDGSAQADCRVNGEDWQAGQRALCDCARTWPDAGFEVRKQYVVLQTASTR